VIDLSSSSDEEDLITATSRDFELAQRLFGELNRAVLGPSDDGKIIILSDSNEEEAREEKTTRNEDVTASAVVNPAPTSADTDNAPMGAKNDNSNDQTPDQEARCDNSSGGDAGEP
jgi:hypothetical protein